MFRLIIYDKVYLKQIYIMNTHDLQTRAQVDRNENKKWAETVKFTKLEILNSEEEANKAIVEFKAHYTDENNENHIHHEQGEFFHLTHLAFLEAHLVY